MFTGCRAKKDMSHSGPWQLHTKVAKVADGLEMSQCLSIDVYIGATRIDERNARTASIGQWFDNKIVELISIVEQIGIEEQQHVERAQCRHDVMRDVDLMPSNHGDFGCQRDNKRLKRRCRHQFVSV